jgi:hypothetical protein
MSEGDIAAIQCADYTLGKRQNRKVADLVGGFGSDCTGGGANEESFGGAGDAAEDAAAAHDSPHADGTLLLPATEHSSTARVVSVFPTCFGNTTAARLTTFRN